MKKHVIFMMLVAATLTYGCNEKTGDYLAASSISKNGFAVNDEEMRKLHGREINIWGFVDHGNMYGDEKVKQILKEWWSGHGPESANWSFNLKSREDDDTGHSFSVHVFDDEGRDELLEVFLNDARAQRATKVFVKGRIFTFDAPTNVIGHKGLYMEVKSCRDILLELPDEK
jgi:hypothetical protein